MITKPLCANCGEPLITKLSGIYDTRFGIDSCYSIGECEICGTEQIFPIPSADDLRQYYENYYNFHGESNTRYTRWRAWAFSSFLYRLWLLLDGDISFHSKSGTGRLLDVGCNEGRGLELYRKNGFTVEGLELNKEAAEVARSQGFTVHTEAIEDFQPREQFDIIVLANVLEHSPDPQDFLSHIGRILKTGGEVWISCPNRKSMLRRVFGRSWINWHVPFHIVHFSYDSLVKLLAQQGFTVSSIKYETPALWISHSLIAFIFACPGRTTYQLRNPFLVGITAVAFRSVMFPVLWLLNRMGRGDCLAMIATKV